MIRLAQRAKKIEYHGKKSSAGTLGVRKVVVRMDIKTIKQHFPVFALAATTEPLIYLDNAATTQKPIDVIDAISMFYTAGNANVHRGLYPLAEQATAQYEGARATVAAFINAGTPSEIVFTKGTTEAINLVASSWGSEHLKPGDVVLLSQVEHHANLLPWVVLAEKRGIIVRYIPYDQQAKKLSLERVDLNNVKLLAVQHTTNVLGNVWDDDFANLYALIKQVKAIGGAVLLDVAQSVAHMSIDVQLLNCDFLAFSGHKLYGPTGVGVLYVHGRWHGSLQPYQVGGSMLHHASYTGATWAPMPHLLEAGTPPIAGVIGLSAALKFMKTKILLPVMANHETMLCKKLAAALACIPEIYLVTEHQHATHQHLVSFYHARIHAHDIASFLGARNIAVRAGNHCAQPLIDLLGVPALVRVSLGVYNTIDDIDQFLEGLEEVLNFLTV